MTENNGTMTRMQSMRDERSAAGRRALRILVLSVAAAAASSSTGAARRGSEARAPEGAEATVLPLEAGNALTFLDFESKPGETIIGVTSSGPLLYNTSYETGPSTLIVEIPGADSSQLQATAAIGTPEVSEVKASQSGPAQAGVARLEVRKAAGTRARVMADPKDPRRLLVVVAAESRDSAPEAEASMPPAGETLAPPRTTARPVVAEPDVADERPALAEPDRTAAPERAAAAQRAPSPGHDLTLRQAPASRSEHARLLETRVERAADGRNVVRLVADRPLSHTSFILDNPLRLCIDLLDAVNESASGTTAVREGAVMQVKVAQNMPLPEPITRVVIHLRENAPHELVEGPNSLAIVVGRGGPALAALPGLPGDRPAAEAASLLTLPQGSTTDYSASSALAAGPPLRETAGPATITSLSAPTSSSDERFESVEVTDRKENWTGEPISISMKDADLQDVFRLFHAFSGLNIVVDQSVKGKTITLELRDVPWDQALALVLQTNGLGQVVDGNIMRIAPLAKLSADEKAQRDFDDAREVSGQLESIAIPLSYATVANAEALIRKSLSSRGDVSSDRRTNTLIVKDLKKYLEDVKALVALLDTPTRQVQIEARIVETTVDFQKSAGIRWGFGYIADRAVGNTTGFSFPRSINTDYAVNLPGTGASSTLGLSFRNILNTFALDIVIDSLESHGKARVISRPMVVVQNNQRATISSGFNIPITNTTATETDVTFVPAQLSLNVTPQITADNNVIMDVQVNNDSPGFLVGENPSISTRQAQTVVAVPDGGTTVIGGIYQVNEGVSSTRVPLLSRIPLLGWLFRNKSVTRTNDELLVFVTPHIVKQY